MSDATVEFVDSDEAWEIFDEQAHATLGISGEEFARNWDNGVYRDSTDNRLMKLVILRPARARED